jgi:hypothetical protein
VAAAPDHTRRGRRPPLSFGVHQGVEYLVAILLALTAIRLPPESSTPALLGALAVVGLALLTDGPLGGFRLLGRRAHRAVDVLFAMVLAASPLALGWDNVVLVVLAEMLALIFAVLVVRTTYSPVKRPPAPAPPAPRPSRSTTTTNGAMRAAGRVVGKVGRQGPRALGRFVGRHTRR